MIGPAAQDPTTLAAMAACLRHRGPDAGGVWGEGPVALTHRRLAVIGLGDAGAQPMRSAGDRFVVAYNGELYNHRNIRRELEAAGRAPAWKGGSDTETLLAGIEAWGLDELLPRTVGMFAFALWDRQERRLSLVRDRLGEKPLSWAMHRGTLLFASQPSAFRQVPDFVPTIDPQALADLLRYAQIPGERTLHQEVRELRPGTLLEVRIDRDDRPVGEPSIRTWWSFDEMAREASSDPVVGDDDTRLAILATTLDEAVRSQMLADVPIGAFLSGGIDSSLIVATMQANATRPVRTFTIGFDEPAYDESGYARTIARHLGTDHTEFIVTADEGQAIIPDLPHVYDEPFADSSQIPTLLVSRLARRDVTVALSGDGGDELFSGYDRYAQAARATRIPRSVALAAAGLYGLTRNHRGRSAALALGRGPAPAIRRLLSANPDADRLVLGVDPAEGSQRFAATWAATEGLGDVATRFMALDTTGYLPDDVLHKVDRAAMAVSLETRVPLLDHRVVELAWRLPIEMKMRGGVGKWALRELLARHLPRELFERPKSGFAVPIGRWLRGPLRPWAEDLLAPDALRREGLLDVTAVRRLWARHLGASGDTAHEVWPVLMFRAWSETHHGGTADTSIPTHC